ncbi:adhesion G-protein coupled receptor G2-like [Mobula hypostoma]|uniref:adhesion G-protein coupled receptor G2-like n=1 Tax=Mobula hypostoma TaxID=723540 RepID=UPI002FC31829
MSSTRDTTESSNFNKASSPTHTTERSTLNEMSSTRHSTETSTLNEMSSSRRTTESSTFNEASSPTHTTERSTLNEMSSTRHSTETSTLNEMSSSRHTTESSTFNEASSPTHTTERSTPNEMSSTRHSTETSTLNEMSSSRHTTESSTFNEASSPTHTTESSTFNEASSPTDTTERSTLNEMSSTRHSTETSTLNEMSSSRHTTESSTFNEASSPTHTTERSTLNEMSSTRHSTETSTLNEMSSSRHTTESSTFNEASSPTHTTETSTLNVISPPPTVTGNDTMAMTSSVQNTTGNSSKHTTKGQMNTTEGSTVTSLTPNTTESSTTDVTTVQMNTTESSTVTSLTPNTTDISNVTSLRLNTPDIRTVTSLPPNTADISTVTSQPLNTPESSNTDVTTVEMITTDISTVTSLPLNTPESSITDVTTVEMITTEDSTVTSLTSKTTGSSITDMTTVQLNTTDISTVTSPTPNTTEDSTVTALTPNTTVSNITDVTSVQVNTTENSTVTPLTLNTTADSTVTSLTPNTTVNSTTGVTSVPMNTTVNSTTGVTSVPMNTTGNSTVNATLIPESPPATLVTLNITNLSETDVAAFVSELEKILQLEAIDAGMATELIGVISALLNAPPAVLASSSTRLIQSVDTIGLKLNFSTESINITSSSLALAVSKINASDFNGADFTISDITNLQVSLDKAAPPETFAAIRLPPSLLSNLTSENQELASRVQFTFYERPTLFQDPSTEETSALNSYIIASSVANLSIVNLMDPVQITFRNIEPTENNSDVRCVFWDFSRNNGSGGWNSDGCRTTLKASNETICECDHLTHFGILLVISRDKIDEKNNRILTFITYIGCGLSSILLAITLVTYLAFEKLRRDYPSKILINLCTALLFLNMTFLIDSWISGFSIKGLCIAVAVFLHYFLLVSFTWMSLEAVHMYLALVKVFNTYVRKYMLKFCIIGWGTPSIVIAIILIIRTDNYGLGHYDKIANTTSDMFCWIKDDIVFYVAAVAYFCVMFLLNFSMFIVVMIQFCRIKNQKQHQNAEKNILQNIRSVTGLTFLLGITWGFAFFAWAPVNIPFMYLFAIFNTLQGTFIFIFHCLAKENVQKQWRRYLCCGKLRLAENSDWSRTATNNTKKLQPLVQAKSLSSTSNNSLQYHSSLFLVQEYSSHPNANGAKA